MYPFFMDFGFLAGRRAHSQFAVSPGRKTVPGAVLGREDRLWPGTCSVPSCGLISGEYCRYAPVPVPVGQFARAGRPGVLTLKTGGLERVRRI